MERVLIKFTKTGGAKFISHLDTMRTLHRAMRRARIPVAYSKGFNPHASISVAAPLSLGIESSAEYADVELEITSENVNIKEMLNKSLPEGIRIVDVISINEKMPSAMGTVEGAKYSIALRHDMSKADIIYVIESILSSSEIVRNKRTKSGEKMIDIRPLIKDIKLVGFENDRIKIECLLYTGSKGSIGPDAVAELLKEYSKNNISGYPYIVREEIYGLRGSDWIDLYPVLWHGAKFKYEDRKYYIYLSYKKHESIANAILNSKNEEHKKYYVEGYQYEFLKKCTGKKTIRQLIDELTFDVEIKDIKRILYELSKENVMLFSKEAEEYYEG
jgi:radical SAM-linked protein